MCAAESSTNISNYMVKRQEISWKTIRLCKLTMWQTQILGLCSFVLSKRLYERHWAIFVSTNRRLMKTFGTRRIKREKKRTRKNTKTDYQSHTHTGSTEKNRILFFTLRFFLFFWLPFYIQIKLLPLCILLLRKKRKTKKDSLRSIHAPNT